MDEYITLTKFLNMGNSTFYLGARWPVVSQHAADIRVKINTDAYITGVSDGQAQFERTREYRGYDLGWCDPDVRALIEQEIGPKDELDRLDSTLNTVFEDTMFEDTEFELNPRSAFLGLMEESFYSPALLNAIVAEDELEDVIEEAADFADQYDNSVPLLALFEQAERDERVRQVISMSERAWEACEYIAKYDDEPFKSRAQAFLERRQ